MCTYCLAKTSINACVHVENYKVVVRILFAIIISIIKEIRRKLSDLISLRFNRGKWVAEIFSQEKRKERKKREEGRKAKAEETNYPILRLRLSREKKQERGKKPQKAASGRNSLSLLSAAIEPITRTAVETFNRRLRPSRRLWMTK